MAESIRQIPAKYGTAERVLHPRIGSMGRRLLARLPAVVLGLLCLAVLGVRRPAPMGIIVLVIVIIGCAVSAWRWLRPVTVAITPTHVLGSRTIGFHTMERSKIERLVVVDSLRRPARTGSDGTKRRRGVARPYLWAADDAGHAGDEVCTADGSGAAGGSGRIEGFLDLDLDRASRRGAPEAVLCDAKTVEQVGQIAATYTRLAAEGREDLGPVLFTRADEARAEAVLAALPDASHDPSARFLAWPAAPPAPSGGLVIVACAGTSDLPVAREAELTARQLGRPTKLIADIGIAGLHRLQSRLPELREAACVVVAAGMDGALPTVIAGQIPAPVVALPTSVGYGVAAGGVTAALTMLSACAPGIGVVNIDNGYGAGHLAAQIARWAPAPE